MVEVSKPSRFRKVSVEKSRRSVKAVALSQKGPPWVLACAVSSVVKLLELIEDNGTLVVEKVSEKRMGPGSAVSLDWVGSNLIVGWSSGMVWTVERRDGEWKHSMVECGRIAGLNMVKRLSYCSFICSGLLDPPVVVFGEGEKASFQRWPCFAGLFIKYAVLAEDRNDRSLQYVVVGCENGLVGYAKESLKMVSLVDPRSPSEGCLFLGNVTSSESLVMTVSRSGEVLIFSAESGKIFPFARWKWDSGPLSSVSLNNNHLAMLCKGTLYICDIDRIELEAKKILLPRITKCEVQSQRFDGFTCSKTDQGLLIVATSPVRSNEITCFTVVPFKSGSDTKSITSAIEDLECLREEEKMLELRSEQLDKLLTNMKPLEFLVTSCHQICETFITTRPRAVPLFRNGLSILGMLADDITNGQAELVVSIKLPGMMRAPEGWFLCVTVHQTSSFGAVNKFSVQIPFHALSFEPDTQAFACDLPLPLQSLQPIVVQVRIFVELQFYGSISRLVHQREFSFLDFASAITHRKNSQLSDTRAATLWNLSRSVGSVGSIRPLRAEETAFPPQTLAVPFPFSSDLLGSSKSNDPSKSMQGRSTNIQVRREILPKRWKLFCCPSDARQIQLHGFDLGALAHFRASILYNSTEETELARKFGLLLHGSSDNISIIQTSLLRTWFQSLEGYLLRIYQNREQIAQLRQKQHIVLWGSETVQLLKQVTDLYIDIRRTMVSLKVTQLQGGNKVS